MLQIARNPQTGRCAFADRYQFRLELSWRSVPGAPDFGRMISDYTAKLLEEGQDKPQPTHHGPWRGLHIRAHGRLSTRFGRYFSGESCLVELVFLWPEEPDTKLEAEVLESLAEEPEHNGKYRRWKAFGMDLLAAKHLPLQSCQVQAANAEMTFANEKSRTVERFARRGLVPEWLREPLDAWLRKHTPGRPLPSPGALTRRGHQIEQIAAEIRPPGLLGLLGKRIRHDAAAWICPRDGRLYTISLSGPPIPATAERNLAGHRLSCCSALPLGP
ncbi:MAG: hypothetical protein HQ592_17275 [Planctomycetes bacterium]|nr:hypothetical protein [Planctomycetota bacterium]